MADDVGKFRAAHPGIEVIDAAIATMAPFPSLHANDFIVYIESKGVPPEVVEFVRGIAREMAWTYDNWQKAQRDGNPTRLIEDMIRNADGAEYAFTERFLRDYAKANNITLSSTRSDRPAWETLISPAVSVVEVKEDAARIEGNVCGVECLP